MSDELLGARRLRAVLDEHRVRPKKALGQNFVIDPNTIRKVVRLADPKTADHVLEIGAGAGSLTLGLAARGARVTAVEADTRLIPVLEETVGVLDNVTVLPGDALRLDLGKFDADLLVANLPYNIAATLVIAALEQAPSLRGLTVMTQKEVGRRLAAAPGDKVYGQTSVLVAYYAKARVAARVSRNAFWPVPGVDSVIVQLDRKPELPDVDRATFLALVRAGFSQRRKTLRRALAALLPDDTAAGSAFASAAIAPTARAEELSLDDFVELAKALTDRAHLAG